MPASKRKDEESTFDRLLDYEVRHAGWIIFRSVYWSIYLLVLGVFLLYYAAHNVDVSLQIFFGIALSILAVMIILYGFAEVLHHKLMRKYS
jgi:hypothetical protein